MNYIKFTLDSFSQAINCHLIHTFIIYKHTHTLSHYPSISLSLLIAASSILKGVVLSWWYTVIEDNVKQEKLNHRLWGNLI